MTVEIPEIKRGRDMDGWIAENILGWEYKDVPPDASGQNAGKVLVPPPPRELSKNFKYPPKGKIHFAYHVPQYTTDIKDAATLVLDVGLETIPAIEVFNPLALCKRAIKFWADKKGVDISEANL